MALATGGGGRFCQGRALRARSTQRSGDPLQVLPPLPGPLPEAGALDEGRKSVLFLVAVCSCACGPGVAGQERAPLRKVAEDRRAENREETSSLPKNRLDVDVAILFTEAVG